MIYFFLILISISSNIFYAAAGKDLATRTPIEIIGPYRAKIDIDQDNSSLEYKKGKGFTAKLHNKPSCFIEHKVTATNETQPKLMARVGKLQSNPNSLVAFQLNSDDTTYSTCVSYAYI